MNYLACYTTIPHKHPISIVQFKKPVGAVLYIFMTNLAWQESTVKVQGSA